MSIVVSTYTAIQNAEKRVAIVPQIIDKYIALGAEVVIEQASGSLSAYPDSTYANTRFFTDKNELCKADIIVAVDEPSEEIVQYFSEGSIFVGLFQPLTCPQLIKAFCEKNITSFTLTQMPRISRAQAMDVLSSQATVAGYKSVLIAANASKCFFPMLTTAAGTIRPTKVLVLGVGVAGLQAIATAKRLGAIVEAYDVRPATKEQVESLGARFISLDIDAQTDSGYARDLTDEEKQQAEALLAKHVAEANVVITTAAIPGKPAPRLVNKQMVDAMKPGSIIVDLAAESGGNCELTQLGESVEYNEKTIIGPENLASQLPTHASEMLSKNIFNFINGMINEGQVHLDWDDELISGCAVTHQGQIKHPELAKTMGSITS